jgi:hypothetical protein
MFNVLYNGRKIYTSLTHEECAEVLDELSEKHYNDLEFDINLLELEEV